MSGPVGWWQRLWTRNLAAAQAPGRAGDDALFDEAFQRKLEYLSVVSRRLFAGRLRAERRTKKSGSGIEFADHRSYYPGDDLRALDWNMYARSEKLLVKQFEEEEDLPIHILLDCSRSMGAGTPPKFDHARRLAAALAYVGLANLDRVALTGWSTLVRDRLPAARGRGQVFKMFAFLRGLECSGETALADAVRAFSAENKRRGVAIVVSDLYDPAGFERGLNALRYRRFEPMVVHVVDDREADPGVRGDLLLVDVETGSQREVTLTPELIARYRVAHGQWRGEIESFCKSRQIPYVAADVGGAFDDQVLRLFRRLGVLG